MDRTATIENANPPNTTAPSALPRGATLDRYVVLEPLGSGGMGVVYAAFDPELDRRIALKLVHPKLGGTPSRGDTQRRLAREAKALAQLNHPNVLAVHDVGMVGGQLFIATELVDGWDLATWLRRETPSRSKILSMFQQAGAGLAAAHDAGLVHRDFKLGNVMVGRDGRVRVVDFGLASGWRRAPPTPSGSGATKDGATTQASTAMGTPTYAAPEQLAGQSVTAAADQFSFCVALYRALCDALPFEPHTTEHPRDPDAWQLDERPLGRLPNWVQRPLRRGLRFAPDDRYPSMTALLTDLDNRRGQRRQRTLIAALVAVAVGTASAIWFTTALRDRQRCGGGEERFATVWNPMRRQAIAEHFHASGLAYADDAWRGVKAMLDGHGARWADMYREACRATVVEATQSTALLDRRMACLDRRLREVDALIDVFAFDPTVIEHAVKAAGALPTIAQCADTRALAASIAPPADPEQQRLADQLRDRLADAEALVWTGRYQDCRDHMTSLLPAIEALGYWPLTADALLLLGRLEEQEGVPETADAFLARALEAATAAGDDRGVAEALVHRVRVAGYQQADFDRGARYASQAEAALGRLNRPDDLAAMLAGNLGAVLAEQGELETAYQSHQAALEIATRAHGADHPRTGIALTRVGDMLREKGGLAEAATYYARALAISRQHNGDSHPSTTRLHSRRGTILLEQGNFEGASESFAQALAASRRTHEENHPYLAVPLTYLGHARLAMGDTALAVEHYQEALAILERRDRPDDRRVAVVVSGLGRAASAAGDFAEARRRYQQALTLRERVYGPEHPTVAETAFNLGEVAKKQGDYTTALDLFGRALDVWRTSQPDNHFLVAVGLTGKGEALLGTGATGDALLLLEEALTLQPADRASEFRAATAFALARALGELGIDPARARRLAESALADLAQARTTERDMMERIDAWLAIHPGTP